MSDREKSCFAGRDTLFMEIVADSILEFQTHIFTYFRQLRLAAAYLEGGRRYLQEAPPEATVELNVAHDVTTEPMRLSELLPHSHAVGAGVSELFQMKAIAAWSDLLSHLFDRFISAHLDGTQSFPELKRMTTYIDFSQSSD